MKVFRYFLLLIVSSVVFFLIHRFVLIEFIDVGQFVLTQHLFLVLLMVFILASVYVIYKMSPIHSGYALLGLLMAKMMIAGLFVYRMGWLEDSGTMSKRIIFLFFYFLYSGMLIFLSTRIVRNIEVEK